MVKKVTNARDGKMQISKGVVEEEENHNDLILGK